MDEVEAADGILITVSGLEATFATHPAEVLAALRSAAVLRARLIRPDNPAEEPASVFRAVAP